MIKAIIFDHFGVLVDSVYDTLYADLPDRDRQLARSIGAAADRGEITNAERDEQIMPFLGNSRVKIDAARGRARRNEELLSLILELRHDYKIGMLSNAASGLVESFFSADDMKKYFDDIVLSYKVRLTKPDQEIYLLAIDRIGVAPHECIFVDDDWRNVMAAEAVGMHGIVYRDFAQFRIDLQDVLGESQASNA
jgi:HAD superfamily hydrolase (TIGR01509 family)